MAEPSSLPASYFESKYQADIDPWQFRSSAYEQQKYAATLKALTRQSYRQGLEIGCSIGVFSSLVVPYCTKLVAIDASATAIVEAERQSLSNVDFVVATLPDAFPEGRFDLILLSEVLYYFAPDDLRRIAALCLKALDPDGEIILCHWLGETNYPLTGRQANDLFATTVAADLPIRSILHEDIYRLERLAR